MELLAAIVGLEKLRNPKTKVLVVSDSKYVVDAVEKRWVFQWEKINFKAKKNPDLWMRFLKIYRKHQVDFQWVAEQEMPEGVEAVPTTWCSSGVFKKEPDPPKSKSKPGTATCLARLER
jgi:ribonuclease HI